MKKGDTVIWKGNGERGRIESINDTFYAELRRILDAAFEQSATGKGRERHATGEPWHKQPIVTIGREDRDFCTGQVREKCLEAKRLQKDAAVRELLGAIVYLAAEIYIRENE